MTMRVQASLMLIVAVAMMGLASCDHYNCASGPNLGSGCTSSGGSGGLSGGGSTNGTPSAFVFAVDSSLGTMDGFTLSTSAGTFAPTPSYIAPTIPSNDSGQGIAVAQGKYLYALFDVSGQIYGWTIDATGNLTTISGSPFSAPYAIGSSAGGRQGMITNPAGTLLFVGNQGEDAIHIYQIGSGGTLTEAGGSPLFLSFMPENMATDGLGSYLYIGNVVSGSFTTQIAAYKIGTGGSLTAVSGSPFISPQSSSEFSMWQLQGDPSGAYMIGTTGVAGNPFLYVFSVTQSGTTAGAITPVPGSPFATVTGFTPYTIAVQPSAGGNLVYSFSLATGGAPNPVEGYQLNLSTGALTPVSGSPFTAVDSGFLGQFDPSGKFLFVYDTALTQVAPLDVGSGGILTQPTSAVNTIDSFWAVSDVP